MRSRNSSSIISFMNKNKIVISKILTFRKQSFEIIIIAVANCFSSIDNFFLLFSLDKLYVSYKFNIY